jgi:sodium-dependent dicarboxylate transporter 2/3/5
MRKKLFSLAVPLLAFSVVLAMPSAWFAMPGITVLEQRILAVFFLAALSWVLEPIPIFATSLVIIVLELLMVSNRGLWFLRNVAGTPEFGKLLSFTEIMGVFASPVIMLFLGGFFLAMAATKYRLDINLARVLLKPFGSKPRTVLLGS